MIGGSIIEVLPQGDKARVWCVDRNGDEAAIYIKITPEMPVAGDQIWWQQRTALWTPKDRRFVDRHLERVGYSFDPLNGDK